MSTMEAIVLGKSVPSSIQTIDVGRGLIYRKSAILTNYFVIGYPHIWPCRHKLYQRRRRNVRYNCV